MSDTSAADRCQGVLIGLAAGDRNGGPIRMAVRLAESLLDCGGFNPADILERYLCWWKEGAFDTGPVSARALALIAAGLPASDATAQVHREFGGKTAGCNPAHRSLPLSMLASIPDEDLAGCAMTEARLTHHDPLAGEVAAAVNTLCRSLIRGVPWDDATRQSSFADQDGPGTNGGYASDVLRSAVYFVNTSASFTEALERSLSFAGPANYCPVLVGAIGGARWSASAIPQAALAHVDILPRVQSAAEALPKPWLRAGRPVEAAPEVKGSFSMVTRTLAILLFDDVEVLDFCGPFEVFSVANRFTDPPAFNVLTVAEKAGPVLTRGGLSVNPQHRLTDCPQADMLLVPGGQGTRKQMHNPALIEWINRASEKAEMVLSVCTGALLLAKTGLLDGLEATTHHGAIDLLRQTAPKTTVHANRRLVDNGRFVCSAGIAAGIDMSLYLVAKLLGQEIAEKTARQMEYPWRP